MKLKFLLTVLTLALALSGCAAEAPEPTTEPPTVPATEAPAEAPTEAPAEAPTEGSETASLAPDITVYDIDGNAVHLSDFLGKPVILNFWASWCGPCKSEMPDFQEKYEELGDSVQFLVVNLTDGESETVDTASAFITEQGYTFPVFYDTDLDGAYTYGVQSIPTTYFIDAEGHAIAMAKSALDAETLQKGIDMILP